MDVASVDFHSQDSERSSVHGCRASGMAVTCLHGVRSERDKRNGIQINSSISTSNKTDYSKTFWFTLETTQV